MLSTSLNTVAMHCHLFSSVGNFELDLVTHSDSFLHFFQ